MFNKVKLNENGVDIISNAPQNQDTDIVTSTLKKNAALEDKGNFTCIVKNDLFEEDPISSTTSSQVYGEYLNCQC